MPLRQLLRYLTQNEQLIQRLAESYPIKRAAQLTASWIHRSKLAGGDAAKKSEAFKNIFIKELKDGIEEVKKIKK